MKLFVAIVERNERNYISNTINSIIESCNCVPKNYNVEIYVIDGGSTDGTVELILREFAPRGIKILFDNGIGLGAAHNFALKTLNCDIILLTFGDELVDTKWIKSILQTIKYSNVAAVFGPVYILNPRSMIEKYANWKLKRYFSKLKRGQHVSYAAATNLAVKRDIALKVGGFREDLIDADDAEFTYRLSKAGYKVVFEPEMIVYHQKAEEAQLGTMIRATMLVAFGYGQVAAIHGMRWHPVCPIYASTVPLGTAFLVLLALKPLFALSLAVAGFATIAGYFVYSAIKSRSLVPLIGVIVEPLRLLFASISFIMGYLYQKSLYRRHKFAQIIRRVFDYIRLHVGH